MDNSATITLYASAGGDGLSTKNMDDQGAPIIVPGVPPDPDSFDGQFVQIDVLSFTSERPDGSGMPDIFSSIRARLAVALASHR